MNPKDVPIPLRMKHLAVDARGYAVPAPVVIDANGKPLFSVNDETLRQRMFEQDLCGICGQPLFRARWLVGGPGSAFHPHGAYLDPAMHTECLHYSMQVCPYLAAPKWASQGFGLKQVAQAALPENGILKVIGDEHLDAQPEVLKQRPQLFVCVQF